MPDVTYGDYKEEWSDDAPDFYKQFEWEPPWDYDSNWQTPYLDDEDDDDDDDI